MKKKLISIILTSTLVVGTFLVGCEKKETANVTVDTGNEQQSVEIENTETNTETV